MPEENDNLEEADEEKKARLEAGRRKSTQKQALKSAAKQQIKKKIKKKVKKAVLKVVIRKSIVLVQDFIKNKDFQKIKRYPKGLT